MEAASLPRALMAEVFNILNEILIFFRSILVSTAAFGQSLLQGPQEFVTLGASSGEEADP